MSEGSSLSGAPMKIIGGKLMAVCPNCSKIIRLDKPILGSLHACTTEEEQRLYGREIARRYELTKAAFEKA